MTRHPRKRQQMLPLLLLDSAARPRGAPREKSGDASAALRKVQSLFTLRRTRMPGMSAVSTPARMAAVLLAPEDDVEAFLLPIVAALRTHGLSIGGMTAPAGEPKDLCRRPMHLENLITGERVKISQDLGSLSRACALDPGQLAVAGRFLRDAIVARADLLVLNKFGKLEAGGAGLRAELIEVLSADIPLLTTVKPELADAWLDFVGEYGLLLPPDEPRVVAWCLAARPPARAPHDGRAA